MASPVESTIRSFREQELASLCSVLGTIILVTTGTQPLDEVSKSSLGGSALLEFVTLPIIGTLSDRKTRKKAIVASLAGLAIARIGRMFSKILGFDNALVQGLGSMCMNGFLVSTKAAMLDLSNNPVQYTTALIKLGVLGACGELFAPIFTRAVHGLSARDSGSYCIAAVTAIGCTCAALVTVDSHDPEITSETEASAASYSPLSFLYLGSSSKHATKAMVGSMLMQITNIFTVESLLNQLDDGLSPALANARIKLHLCLTFSSIIGSMIARTLQASVGLYDQATVATCAYLGGIVSMIVKRPYAAIACMMFTQRGADATDAFLLENRTGAGGRGEAITSMANWHTVTAIVGSIILGTLRTRNMLGVHIVSASSVILAEHLRRKLREKDLFPDSA